MWYWLNPKKLIFFKNQFILALIPPCWIHPPLIPSRSDSSSNQFILRVKTLQISGESDPGIRDDYCSTLFWFWSNLKLLVKFYTKPNWIISDPVETSVSGEDHQRSSRIISDPEIQKNIWKDPAQSRSFACRHNFTALINYLSIP